MKLEREFVDKMTSGIQAYSRPLRHHVIDSVDHAALFQNVEKVPVLTQSQFQRNKCEMNRKQLRDKSRDTRRISLFVFVLVKFVYSYDIISQYHAVEAVN